MPTASASADGSASGLDSALAQLPSEWQSHVALALRSFLAEHALAMQVGGCTNAKFSLFTGCPVARLEVAVWLRYRVRELVGRQWVFIFRPKKMHSASTGASGGQPQNEIPNEKLTAMGMHIHSKHIHSKCATFCDISKSDLTGPFEVNVRPRSPPTLWGSDCSMVCKPAPPSALWRDMMLTLRAGSHVVRR